MSPQIMMKTTSNADNFHAQLQLFVLMSDILLVLLLKRRLCKLMIILKIVFDFFHIEVCVKSNLFSKATKIDIHMYLNW